MSSYPAQPLDLMQHINGKLQDPTVHLQIECGEQPKATRLVRSLDRCCLRAGQQGTLGRPNGACHQRGIETPRW